ncbi:anthrone oxygenase family protein [Streptomyces sp. NPDC059708]|uniref:anthrone oxygenase family protein n=1 Tax=Streptomyces sp. NPDC059708 TaxID=3346916 RepID=UPI003689A2A5
MFPTLIAVLLVCTGVAAGDMFCTAVGLAPLMRVQSYRTYVSTVRFLQPRYDPAMPVINSTALLAGAAACVFAPSALARGLLAGAAVLVVAVIAVSVAKAVPINRFVLGLDPQAEPADWRAVDPRAAWRRWHLVRTAAMTGALALDAGAVASLL